MSVTDLGEIDFSPKALPRLQTFLASGTIFSDLSFIPLFTSLTYMDLTNCGLSSMPNISDLSNLDTLVLNQNSITEITIALPVSLTYVTMKQNSLESLSDELARLPKLRCPPLSDNQVKSITSSVGELQRMECMDLSHTSLSTCQLSSPVFHVCAS